MEFVMPILEGAWRYVLTLRISDYLDIALMAYAIYWLLKLVGTSKVESVGKVILLFLLALMLSDAFSLNGIYFLLSHILSLGALALIVLFQPEITVHADEKLLSQVLINLLKNAMQALEGQADGKIRMEVDTEKNQLLIRVTDNGPGVPSDLIEDIFVPFFTTKATGSGIGLSLSRQIIRMHGGELSVASLPYRETCFTVSLPVKP